MSKQSTPRIFDAVIESSFQKSEENMLKKYKPSLDINYNFKNPDPEILKNGLQKQGKILDYLQQQKHEFQLYNKKKMSHIYKEKKREIHHDQVRFRGGKPKHDDEFQKHFHIYEYFGQEKPLNSIPLMESGYRSKPKLLSQTGMLGAAPHNKLEILSQTNSHSQVKKQEEKPQTAMCLHSASGVRPSWNYGKSVPNLFDKNYHYNPSEEEVQNAQVGRNSSQHLFRQNKYSLQNYMSSNNIIQASSDEGRPKTNQGDLNDPLRKKLSLQTMLSDKFSQRQLQGPPNSRQGLQSRQQELSRNSSAYSLQQGYWKPNNYMGSYFSNSNVNRFNIKLDYREEKIKTPFLPTRTKSQMFQRDPQKLLLVQSQQRPQSNIMEAQVNEKDFQSLKCDDFDYQM